MRVYLRAIRYDYTLHDLCHYCERLVKPGTLENFLCEACRPKEENK